MAEAHPKLSIEESRLREIINEHFDELHCTLWGKGFYLIGEGGAAAQSRVDAMEWFVGEITPIFRKFGIVVTKPDPNQLELDV